MQHNTAMWEQDKLAVDSKSRRAKRQGIGNREEVVSLAANLDAFGPWPCNFGRGKKVGKDHAYIYMSHRCILH
eukprot:1155299-Pelagomonas_calceolata.AAC.3